MSSKALSLLQSYSSDSEDDAPSLSDLVATKKERLPVPDILKSTKSYEDDWVDDPSLHGGRIRSFPHIRGNWASSVFIPYFSDRELKFLLQELIDSCKGLDLKPIETPHISLTKTFVLLHHWIQEFTRSLQACFQPVRSFQMGFSDLEVYANEELTRTFLAIRIGEGSSILSKIVHSLNECLREYKLPPFYEEESFHVSIAWCPGNRKAELYELLPELKIVLRDFFLSHPNFSRVYVNKVHFKTGFKNYSFNLSSS